MIRVFRDAGTWTVAVDVLTRIDILPVRYFYHKKTRFTATRETVWK